jgi:hypothetical protein
MLKRRPRPTTTGIHSPIGPIRRPWAFTKGLIAGAVLVVPVIAACVWLLGRMGYANPTLPMLKSIRSTAVFAGVAAILTAGGVGRIAAQAAMEDGATRKRPLVVATRAFAVAGAGLTMVAAIPHGHLPDHWSGWLAISVFGALAGAACGVVIGAVCGGAAQLGLTDVVALARWPTDALRALLEPEDLAAAVKHGRRRRRITFPFLFPAQARADARAAKPSRAARAHDRPHDRPDQPPSPTQPATPSAPAVSADAERAEPGEG